MKGLECFYMHVCFEEKIDLEKGDSFGKRWLKLGRASPESRLCLNENSKSGDTKLIYIVKSFPSRVLNQATRVEYQLLHLFYIYTVIQKSKIIYAHYY